MASGGSQPLISGSRRPLACILFEALNSQSTFLMPQTSETTLRLAFDPVWSWPVSVLAAVGLIVFVLLTYPRRVRHLPGLWRRTLLTLRLAAALVLALAILRPELQWSKKNRRAAM